MLNSEQRHCRERECTHVFVVDIRNTADAVEDYSRHYKEWRRSNLPAGIEDWNQPDASDLHDQPYLELRATCQIGSAVVKRL